MKTLKENNTKVTKDVLLHRIFQEISDENIEIHDDIYIDEVIPTPQKELSKIRKIQKIVQWFFIALLVISIIYMLFHLDTESTESKVQKTNNNIYTIPKADPIVKQKKETELLDELKEEMNTQTIIEKNSIKEKEIDADVQPAIKLEDPQTEREKAKEALRMQMQN